MKDVVQCILLIEYLKKQSGENYIHRNVFLYLHHPKKGFVKKTKKSETHPVYGILVSTVTCQPAGQLWVVTSLCRLAPLSLQVMRRCGGV